jgi:hypothetical protein
VILPISIPGFLISLSLRPERLGVFPLWFMNTSPSSRPQSKSHTGESESELPVRAYASIWS